MDGQLRAATVVPPPRQTCHELSPEHRALTQSILEQVPRRWPLWILVALHDDGPLRFGQLQRQVTGITQKVLAQTLRTLERDGFVARTIFAEVPPRVEYRLTDLGYEFGVKSIALWQWIALQAEAVEDARRTFDARHG